MEKRSILLLVNDTLVLQPRTQTLRVLNLPIFSVIMFSCSGDKSRAEVQSHSNALPCRLWAGVLCKLNMTKKNNYPDEYRSRGKKKE